MNQHITHITLNRAFCLVFAACIAGATMAQEIGSRPQQPGATQSEPLDNVQLRSIGATIVAYPNPFNEVLHVQAQGIMGKPIKVEIRSAMDGSLVLEENHVYTDVLHLNTTGIPYGQYILTLQLSNGMFIGSREVRRANVR
ncbi:MAG: hypothetical protein JNM31_12675 [Flavobacteriales bacterium]|nr:hypothetical protein [Flavobacteriales bacterium]